MRGDVDYAFEKYWATYSTMAEGEGTAAERLINGYTSQGVRAHPVMSGMGAQMSEELASRIEAFHERMTANAGIAATVNAMDDYELSQALEEITSITYNLAAEYFTAHPH